MVNQDTVSESINECCIGWDLSHLNHDSEIITVGYIPSNC